MGRLAVINGSSCSPEQAKVSIYDRGFLYGDSVFETVRTYAGRLFALDEHVARLVSSASLMGIAVPVSMAELVAETTEAVAEANNPESYARIMLTRGSGPLGLDPELASEPPLRVIMVEPLHLPPKEHYVSGISAHCVQTIRASDAAHSAKLGNYLASALAMRAAREAGADEALVVNRDGYVVEGPTSNVFFIDERGTLCTPPLEIGILAGITRKVVLQLAEEALGLSIDYRALTPSQVLKMEEVFLTSSIRELIPIVSIDGHRISTGAPGEVTRRLHRAFREHVGLTEMPWE